MTAPSRPAPAYRLTEGRGPLVMFLPGYASDMEGTKALALEAWAKAAGRAYLRFDYGGCGASAGAFEEQTLAVWRDDALGLLERFADGPAVLVGSSMGGWIGLLIARDHSAKVAALVGVAPAPDFTDWGFTVEEKLAILSDGRMERDGLSYTRAFWQSGEALRMMFAAIAVDCPVRLLQGTADVAVPWNRVVQLGEMLRSSDVQTLLVKGGDHRLSRASDLALLIAAVEGVLPPS